MRVLASALTSLRILHLRSFSSALDLCIRSLLGHSRGGGGGGATVTPPSASSQSLGLRWHHMESSLLGPYRPPVQLWDDSFGRVPVRSTVGALSFFSTAMFAGTQDAFVALPPCILLHCSPAAGPCLGLPASCSCLPRKVYLALTGLFRTGPLSLVCLRSHGCPNKLSTSTQRKAVDRSLSGSLELKRLEPKWLPTAGPVS